MSFSKLKRAAALPRALALLAAVALAAGLLAFGITEEVPIGSVAGKVRLKENGRALKGVDVYLEPIAEVDDTSRSFHFVSNDKGAFSRKSIPAGEYTIRANSKAHKFEEERITIGEGKATDIEVVLKPNDPYLNMNVSQRVFLPKEQPSFQMDGFLANDKLAVDVFKLNLPEIVKKGGVRDLLEAFSRYANTKEDPAKYGTNVKHLDYKISKQDAEGVFVETVALEQLPVGFYWVRCKSGDIDRGVYVNVSTIGLVSKTGKKHATCFVADLADGSPTEAAAIAYAEGDTLKQAGMSGPDGTLTFDLPSSEKHLIVAKKGDSVAVVNFYANGGEEGDDDNGSGRIYAYSDRPVYKPGDLVQFKGVVRKMVGSDFQVVRSGTIAAELRDADDNLVQTFNLPITTRGTFFGKFSTNKEAKPGAYTLSLEGGGASGSMSVDLAAYRKPEFNITVKPLEKFYVLGQRAKMRVKCEYYFGGPVVGAKVDAYVTRSPYWEYQDEDGEEYTDESGSGEGVTDTSVVTDENGEAIIEFDTKKDDETSGEQPSDYLYSVNVSASEDEKYFEGTGSVHVARGTFDTSISTSDYIAEKGQPVEVTVKAMTHDDDKPLPGKTFKIVAGEENWSGDKVTFEPIETLSATTGPNGEAKLTYTPTRSGGIVLKAITTDELNNAIPAQDYLYVEGAGTPARPGGKLQVTLDKPKYEIGDTAKVLIQTDKPGGFAILAVEADEVLYQKVVNLTQTVTIVRLGVEKAFAPNAQVSVAYIKEKQFYEASEQMVLKLSEQKLKIEVKPDQPKVLPGKSVTYAITTKDQSGQPVAADVSLGVVDESIYAIRKDSTDMFKGFFPRRYISVSTSYSFPEIYLDGGDKGGSNIGIRTKFLDTAYWNPNIQTDASGQARVTVTLPDNLTSWRATVVGATDSTSVGMATSQVQASKPLMIRLETPSYLVVQDEQRISAIVTNDTGQDADVKVRLNIKGLKLDGDTTQTVHVEAGKPATVEWKATAETTGEAEVVATAEISGGANDGVRHTIEVKPHGREFQEVQAGMVKGQSAFDVMVRDGADPNTGRLVLSLSPSIATTLVQSLDGLVQFPYGCVEQTMSRFLPAILVSQALDQTGLSRPDLKAKVPAIAADGLARLAKMQHADGGWGWWEYDDSDPFMTALVLDGLQKAQGAGFKINESMVSRGLDWAAKRLAKPVKDERSRDRTYLAYALAMHGRLEDAKKSLKVDASTADPSELAFGAMTANVLGGEFISVRDDLLGKLKAAAKVTAQTVSWSPGPYSWGEEGTALALTALVKLQPDSALVPKAVRYLMMARRGEYWWSTRDTAYVLVGMTAYLKQTKELANTGGTFTVFVNDKEVKRVAFTQATLLQPDLQITIPMSGLQQGKNSIRIEQSGASVCYYSADLKQIVPDDRLGSVVNNNDLKVTRTYYRMEAKRMEDGTMKLMQSEKPIDQVRSGDVIKVVVKVSNTKDREYVLVEDPVPSNCRVTERDAPYEDEEWGWWWARTVILDDRVSFFARSLPSGDHEFNYIMRAEGDGKSNALPTRVGNMYDPEDIASAGEFGLRVDPR